MKVLTRGSEGSWFLQIASPEILSTLMLLRFFGMSCSSAGGVAIVPNKEGAQGCCQITANSAPARNPHTNSQPLAIVCLRDLALSSHIGASSHSSFRSSLNLPLWNLSLCVIRCLEQAPLSCFSFRACPDNYSKIGWSLTTPLNGTSFT